MVLLLILLFILIRLIHRRYFVILSLDFSLYSGFSGAPCSLTMMSRRAKKRKGKMRKHIDTNRGKWNARKGDRNHVQVPSCSGLKHLGLWCWKAKGLLPWSVTCGTFNEYGQPLPPAHVYTYVPWYPFILIRSRWLFFETWRLKVLRRWEEITCSEAVDFS